MVRKFEISLLFTDDSEDTSLEIAGSFSKSSSWEVRDDSQLDPVDALAARVESCEVLSNLLDRAIWQAKRELRDMAIEMGATQIATSDYVVNVNEKLDYDRNAWQALAEFIPMDELIGSGTFTPSHERKVVVADKWDLGKLKTFFKRGNHIRQVVERSSFPAGYEVRVTRKEADNG
jgi:hypothetical protein